MYRSSKNYRKYKKVKPKGCALCDLGQNEIVEKREHSIVTKNLYPYEIWEGKKVIDHLMVLPKIHEKGFKKLPTEARLEILEIISEFEEKGYDIYARGVSSNTRTVKDHQHTHLIKTANKDAKLTLFIKKPYILFRI